MGQVKITWVQDMQFIGTDSTDHSVVISTPKDGVGMKPSDLLLVSLGGCTGYDMVNLLSKRRVNFTKIRILIDSEQDSDPPWAFQKIHLHYEVAGFDVSPKEVERVIKMSKEKYCSVSATLQPTVDITTSYEIINAQAGDRTTAEVETEDARASGESSRGLRLERFQLETSKAEFAVDEPIWVNFRLLNPSSDPVSFGYLGIAVEEDGQNVAELFHTTYTETTIDPDDDTFAEYRDNIKLPRPGTFVLRLAICYPDVASCSTGEGDWEYLSRGIQVTVR